VERGDQQSHNGVRDADQDDYAEPPSTRFNYNGRESQSPRYPDEEGNQKRGRSDSRGRGSPRSGSRGSGDGSPRGIDNRDANPETFTQIHVSTLKRESGENDLRKVFS
jgi:hypothetical protein